MTSGLAVVTGAAGALGSAVCLVLADAGYRVAGIDQAMVSGDAVAWPPPGGGGGDLADEVAAAFERVAADDEPVRALVNIVGGFRWETIGDSDVGTWDLLYRINVRTALIATRAALPLSAAPGGALVNVGAAGSVRATAGMGAYAAAKSGVSKLTESLAEELKDTGMRVNAVLPSIIDTPANRADMPDAEFARWVRPEALAAVIAFLLSEDAVTGALIAVNGRV